MPDTLLYYREVDCPTDEFLSLTQGFQAFWRRAGSGRRAFYPTRPTSDRAPDGVRTLRSLSSAVRQVGTSGQDAHIFCHGQIFGRNSAGAPTDAVIYMGPSRDSRILVQYLNLTANLGSLSGTARSTRETLDTELAAIKAQFKKSDVRSLTFEGCCVGRHQLFLDLLESLLGVKIYASTGDMMLRHYWHLDSAGVEVMDRYRTGIDPSRWSTARKEWEHSGSVQLCPVDDQLMSPEAQSR